jgi:hypothetical protein
MVCTFGLHKIIEDLYDGLVDIAGGCMILMVAVPRLTHTPKCIRVLLIARVNPGVLNCTQVNPGGPLYSSALHLSRAVHPGAPKCIRVLAAHLGSTMHTSTHTRVIPE